MGGVILRTATLDDVANLAGVELRSALAGYAHIFPDSVPKPTQASLEERWRQVVSDSDRTVVLATVDDTAVGFVVYGPDTSDLPADGVLRKLYVLPDHSGHGLGSVLHDHAIRELRAAGFVKARLWVLERNTVAREMYERRGWKLESWTQTDWPGTGVIEVGYSLELD
jgi:GNAT superfamily N-acetyltransferase